MAVSHLVVVGKQSAEMLTAHKKTAITLNLYRCILFVFQSSKDMSSFLNRKESQSFAIQITRIEMTKTLLLQLQVVFLLTCFL